MTPDVVTLRDWFAGQALAGWAAGRNQGGQKSHSEPEWVARTCYGYADAMLFVRERMAEIEAERAEREAKEWVASAGLTVELGVLGSVYVIGGGGQIIGRGADLETAVADAKAKLATNPAPSTPTSEDDEAWARNLGVSIHATAPRDGWIAECGHTHSMMGMGRTIAEAVRALRAKVEGGTQ